MSKKQNQSTTTSTQTGRKDKKKKQKGSGENSRGTAVPTQIAYRYKGSSPSLKGGGGCVVIKHIEQVGDLALHLSTDPFADGLTTLHVNPGLGETFPWLSTIAPSFGYYRFRSLSFEFVSSSPSTIGGEILMAFDPDASNGPPGSKASLLNFKASVRGSPVNKSTLAIPQSLTSAQGRGGKRPVRGGNDAYSRTVLPTYDAGIFYFRAAGPVALSTVGDVRVHYEVELHDPQSVDPASNFVHAVRKFVTHDYLLGSTRDSSEGGLSYTISPRLPLLTDFTVAQAGRYYLWILLDLDGAATPSINVAPLGLGTESSNGEVVVGDYVVLLIDFTVSNTSSPAGVTLSLVSGILGSASSAATILCVRNPV